MHVLFCYTGITLLWQEANLCVKKGMFAFNLIGTFEGISLLQRGTEKFACYVSYFCVISV